ncbi:MAG: response regulator [Labilithrix sp.]|nr:response regulator [Labilithrix sp.]MCW5815811.1 response regulator [Labilithrix sp.]
MRVLAADDDQGIRNVLERCLKSWGYEVTTAEDGAAAWRVLKRWDSPRVVIIDWDMPGLKGIEVVRLLRAAEHGEEVYILMLTGRMDKEDLVEALEAGADDFLTKPFNSRELQLRLTKAVAFRKSIAARQGVKRNSLTGRAPPSASILGGKYRIEKKIAEGGMASIWLGSHLALGINVAIKFMKPGLAEEPDYASFEREARAAAQLRNEHIVHIYDHGITADGVPYLVMEYLAGESLGDRIDRCGPLAPIEVAEIVDQTAKALVEAHNRLIIHRDVKPENIILMEAADRPHGLAKLVDFGLAKPKTLETTDGGLISGTPSYMSPEHLRAQAPPNVALDLWALAATAFTALTGSLPFDGDSLADIMKQVCVAPPPVPSTRNPALTPAIDAWFAKACAKNPADRFSTPQELASTFRAACADVPAISASGAPIPKSPRLRGLAPTEPDTTALGRDTLVDRDPPTSVRRSSRIRSSA